MCIRDSYAVTTGSELPIPSPGNTVYGYVFKPDGSTVATDVIVYLRLVNGCLLYTSDAADERSSVDLGGRRIIKKKNKKQLWSDRVSN